MSVIEIAELRYHWQERAPAGRRMQNFLQILADKYGFTVDERVRLGNMIQEFSDECLAVHGRLEARRQEEKREE